MAGRTADDFDATLKRMLGGDEDAFRTVFRVMNPTLVRYLSALVGVGDAEDVASETWAQVCRDLPKFRGDGDGFRGWVTTIGRHRAMDHLRALRVRPQAAATDAVLTERAGPDEADTQALIAISTAAAMELIRSLPQEQAEAVLLRAVMGLDAKSAGRILDKRPGAVRTAAYRGLQALAAAVQPESERASEQPDERVEKPSTPAAEPSRQPAGDIFRALIAEEVT